MAPNLKNRLTNTKVWSFLKWAGVDHIIRHCYLNIETIIQKLYLKINLIYYNYQKTKQISDYTVKFKIQNEFEWERSTDLVGEVDIVKNLIDDLKEDDVFYDIGAAIGTYSCFAGKKLQYGEGHIVAFEPMTTNHRRLKENIRINNLDALCTLSEYALSNEDGTDTISIEGKEVGRGGHSIMGDSTDGIAIETRRGDSLISGGYPHPDVMKIDVEGSELQVLQGFGELLTDVRLIYCELHPERIPGISEDVISYLNQYGFRIESIGNAPSRKHIRAVQPE